MTDILKFLNLPNSTVVERKLFKKQFLDNFSLTSNEKKILSECVDSITLHNLLNKHTINILPFQNETHNYQEIAIISVEINNPKKSKDIATIILHIPYPVVLILKYENGILFNISPKRINQNDKQKLTIEEQNFTKWIDITALLPLDVEFLNSLDSMKQPFINFKDFFSSLVDKLIAYSASEISGKIALKEDTKELLANIRTLDLQIIELKNKIKKESNFSDKVKMNIELKKLSDWLEKLKRKLV